MLDPIIEKVILWETGKKTVRKIIDWVGKTEPMQKLGRAIKAAKDAWSGTDSKEIARREEEHKREAMLEQEKVRAEYAAENNQQMLIGNFTMQAKLKEIDQRHKMAFLLEQAEITRKQQLEDFKNKKELAKIQNEHSIKLLDIQHEQKLETMRQQFLYNKEQALHQASLTIGNMLIQNYINYYPLGNAYSDFYGIISCSKEGEKTVLNIATVKTNNKEIAPLRVITSLTDKTAEHASIVKSKLSGFLLNNYGANTEHSVISDIGAWKDSEIADDSHFNCLFNVLKGQPVMVLEPVYTDKLLTLRVRSWGLGQEMAFPDSFDYFKIDLAGIRVMVLEDELRKYRSFLERRCVKTEDRILLKDFNLLDEIDGKLLGQTKPLSNGDAEILRNELKIPAIDLIREHIKSREVAIISAVYQCAVASYADAYHLFDYGTLPLLPKILHTIPSVEPILPDIADYYINTAALAEKHAIITLEDVITIYTDLLDSLKLLRVNEKAKQAMQEKISKVKEEIENRKRKEEEERQKEKMLAEAKRMEAERQNRLGQQLYSEQKFKESLEMYLKAAENGYLGNEYKIGNIYYNGQGIDKNFEEAVKWYKKGVELHDPECQFALGDMLEHGYGIDKNIEEALSMYSAAAEHGHRWASRAMQELLLKKKENEEQHNIEQISPGTILNVGEYPYSENGDNASIEWLVLDKKTDGTALLLCKNIICFMHHTRSNILSFEVVETIWENSSIREWLNGKFFTKYFSADEKKSILESSLECVKKKDGFYNDSRETYVTKDKLFLLSAYEFNQYLTKEEYKKMMCTPFAEKQKRKMSNPNFYWLRSTIIKGFGQNIQTVTAKGNLGSKVQDIDGGVRPAMWINLKNFKFQRPC